MKHVFVLQNQNKQLLTKSGEWSDGRDANSLYRTEHKDEAINQQFEVSSKDYTLRVSLLKCAVNERRNPIIAEADLPEPMAMPEVEVASDAEPVPEVENMFEMEAVPEVDAVSEVDVAETEAANDELALTSGDSESELSPQADLLAPAGESSTD